MCLIIMTNLNKKFSDNIVINDLNLTIKDHEITALVGENGAGKSTLIRMIAGLYKPDSGSIKIDSKEKIGVLLGSDVSLYKNLSGDEIIYYFGKLYGLDDFTIKERVKTLDRILNFSPFISKKAYTYSRGMKQKIAFVISMIHDPDVLLLDEPSTGLDLEATNDIISFIKYLKSDGKTILIATHNIFEISDLSDSIAFIYQGKIRKKVNTSSFFQACPQDEKCSYLISEMKGDIDGEKNCDNY